MEIPPKGVISPIDRGLSLLHARGKIYRVPSLCRRLPIAGLRVYKPIAMDWTSYGLLVPKQSTLDGSSRI
jgi:hypothetical protein